METLTYIRDGVASTLPTGNSLYMGAIGTIGTIGMGTIGGDAHYFDDTVTSSEIRENLVSNKEADNINALKWLLAMTSKGQDVAEFFPDVVKNIVSKSVEIKKMVYMYLVHYADYTPACRDISLLSINSFQKDLSGTNPLIRGLALRVLTTIRVPDIIQIQLLAVRNCANDVSPYVRKCAATAVTKLYYLDSDQTEHIRIILEKLLTDPSTMVLGSAVVAFNEVFPHDYALLHPCYHKLCHLLADIDEWSQVIVLEVLSRYCRTQFKNPIPNRATRIMAQSQSTSSVQSSTVNNGQMPPKKLSVEASFYSDDEEEEEGHTSSEQVRVVTRTIGSSIDLADDKRFKNDHKILLRASLPLLKSRNSGVVLSVCCLHFYCGSDDAIIASQLAKALVRILRNRREIQLVILSSIRSMVAKRPLMFAAYVADFFVKGSDPVYNRLIKLDILCSLCNKENYESILRELEAYVRQTNKDFVAAVTDSIYIVAKLSESEEIIHGCVKGLEHLLICYRGEALAGVITNNIRKLATLMSADKTDSVVEWLARLMLEMEASKVVPVLHESAVAVIAWLTSEYSSSVSNIASDILRVFSLRFPTDCSRTRLQLLNSCVKMSVSFPDDEAVQALMMYIVEMARYDTDTDIRDRSRSMTALMGMVLSTEGIEGIPVTDSARLEAALEELTSHARQVLLGSKLAPLSLYGLMDPDALSFCSIGSLSAQLGHKVAGYKSIPRWATEDSPDSVRTPGESVGSTSDFEAWSRREGGNKSTSKETDVNLKQFYDSKDSEGDASTESSDESEEEEEGEEDESEDEDDDGSDDSSSESSEDKPAARQSTQVTTRAVKAPQPQRSQQQAVVTQKKDLHKEGVLLDADVYSAAVLGARPAADEQILAQLMESFQHKASPSESTAVAVAAVSTSGTINNQAAAVTPVNSEMWSFPPKVIVRSELANGLQVTVFYRHGVSASQLSGASCLVLSIQNKKTQPIRRVRLSFPAEVKRSYISDIPLIEGGACVRIPIELGLALFANKSIRVDVQCDMGSFNGFLVVEAHELLCPVVMAESAFDALKRCLNGGFTEVTREILFTASDLETICKCMRRLLNVHQVTESGPVAKFCGSYRRGMSEDHVLVSCYLKDSSDETKRALVLSVNCSDAVMCATLADHMKKVAGSCLDSTDLEA